MRTFLAIAVGLGLAGFTAVGLYWYVVSWSGRFLAPVRLGMSQTEVRELLGEPLRRYPPAPPRGAVWDYQRWWSGDAEVYFDMDGRVSNIMDD